MSDYFSVAPSQVRSAASRLSGLSQTLRSALTFAPAAGAGDFGDVQLSLDDFADDWGKALIMVEGSMTALGDSAADAAAIYDAQQAEAAASFHIAHHDW